MVFSDLFFIFAFIPSFALLYILASLIDKKMKTSPDTPYNRTKNWVLVLFSLLFYAWGEPVYVFLMLFSVLVNFIAGRVIDRSDRHRKMALVIGLICNILILGVFKYLGFFGSILADLGISVALPTLALPIGISFYTFQSISYLIDVYRRESPAQKRYADLLLYISMFPQLIAGPIVRYDTVATEITDRHVTANDVADGAFRFLVGLGKKVIIANQLSEVADQFLVGGIGNLSTTGAWVGILAFTLQIYFDFSGYSDMAIGIGRCLGFHFKENFNHPYCCNSITDFWRRWHMSLGSFFRDYVYIPLGGNRRHQAWNIFVVWFLTGMWHGASWNFIIWGVYFGFIVAVEKYTILRLKNRMFTPLLHLYSLILVVIGWGIFYFEDFSQMTVFFHSFFGLGETFTDFASQAAVMDKFWLFLFALVLCMPVRKLIADTTERILKNHSIMLNGAILVGRTVLSLAVLVLSVALLVGATNNAFLYTRF
ncbi:MAG: MBOAT family protein [Prevotella sp.]|nr:MBOAT family protein [Prevotella sp.]MDO4980452.1 MBOAT family O-acyltransferase [Prevotellaceae bacterium]